MAKSHAGKGKGKGRAPPAPAKPAASKRPAPSTAAGPPKKKLRKGEVPDFVPLVGAPPARDDDASDAESSELAADDDDADELGEGAEAFLAGLDMKQMARCAAILLHIVRQAHTR
jgi:hypothetical protein